MLGPAGFGGMVAWPDVFDPTAHAWRPVNLILALLVVAAFAGIVEWTRITTDVQDAVRGAQGTYSVLSDPSLTDDQKESRLRQEAPRLFGLLGRIVFGSFLALGLPLGALWALDRLGLISFSEVLAILVRFDFLLAVSALGILALWWMRRRGG